MAKGIYGGRKTREGTVVSDRMDKTVVVAVSSAVKDRLYKKIVRRQRHYMAHDDENDAKLGDVVRIVESRPYSRLKRWKLAEVLIRADRPEVAAEEIDLELLGEVKPEEEEAEAPEAAAEQPPAEEAPAEAPALEEPAAEPPEEAPAQELAAEAGEPAVEEAASEEVPPVEEAQPEPEAAAEEPAPEPEEAATESEEPASEGEEEKEA